MRVYLARHAKAVKRSQWDGPDELRGLTEAGWQQANDLVQLLAGAPVGRILTSPALRCRQSVEPFAAARGLPIQTDERLAEGSDAGDMYELVRSLEAWPSLVCAHGDQIPGLLELLTQAELEVADPLLCEKGSLWMLEGKRSYRRAHYFPPQETSAVDAQAAEPARVRPIDPPARVAVLDLGSTSFHLLIADAHSGGEIKRVTRERRMLRLGSSIAKSTHIPEEAIERSLEAALNLREIAEAHEVECLFAVGTSALRDADNGPEISDMLADALGVPVRVLSGLEEARLIFGAYRQRLGLRAESVMGADLGGGSLELMLGDGRQLDFEATLKLGVARLHGEFVHSDPLVSSELEAMRARIDELLAPHEPVLRAPGLRNCMGSGGTLGALCRVIWARRGSDSPRPSGITVALDELRDLETDLIASSHEQRLATRGIDKRRADLLPTGAIVLCRVAERLGIETFTYCDWGLREGVIIERLGLEDPAGRAG